MRLSSLTLFSFACIITGTALAFSKEHDPLPVVPGVDLKRYQGKWFEIARLPARFERDCAGDVSAEYTLRNDGKVTVVNRCRNSNGLFKESKGIAKLRDRGGPASKLRVCFFWPFYGDYWILDLDRDYKWALVGTPDRRYLWILSRSRDLSDQTYRQLIAKAKEPGFDVARILRTSQNMQ
jgi:apolipoprotein D and lipocalin family protein